MKLRQALRLAGAGALTGAMLLGTAPAAIADDIRDRQWALDAFAAEEIWQQATGKGVVVAVVDSGVDASHPDLVGQVLKGKDTTAKGGNAREDVNGHGTAMASVIAGHGHGPGGGDGVKGLAPGAKILPIRSSHQESEADLPWAEGVRYAVDQGADVINISQGSSSVDVAERDAIAYAIANDVVVVASAGNDGVEMNNYPAAYPGVVSVGGVDSSGSVWSESSWGSDTTLIAPSANIAVADPTAASGYSAADGTSEAAAFVSAAAALVREAHPDLTAGQVINRLVKTAKIPAGESAEAELPDEKFGYGIIRPLRAVTYDIPAGPKEGPLAQPSDDEDTSTASGSDGSETAPGDESTAAQEESSGVSPLIIGVFAVVGLGVIGLVVGLVARRKRKSQPPYPGGPGNPGGPGWQGAPGVPPQYQGQQQPQGQARPYGGPPSAPPPPPNQPPTR